MIYSRGECQRPSGGVTSRSGERIKTRKLTGLGLAKQTGFEQAYISNFLNRKRSLSLEGMDRVLTAQSLSIYDLLNREEINKRAKHSSV